MFGLGHLKWAMNCASPFVESWSCRSLFVTTFYFKCIATQKSLSQIVFESSCIYLKIWSLEISKLPRQLSKQEKCGKKGQKVKPCERFNVAITYHIRTKYHFLCNFVLSYIDACTNYPCGKLSHKWTWSVETELFRLLVDAWLCKLFEW